jgi:hypothetical protein
MEVNLEEVSQDQLTEEELKEFKVYEEAVVEKIIEIPLQNIKIDVADSTRRRRQRHSKKYKFSLTEQEIVDGFINRDISFYECAKKLSQIAPDNEIDYENNIEIDYQDDNKRKTRSSLKPNAETRLERQRKKLPAALRGLMGEGN